MTEKIVEYQILVLNSATELAKIVTENLAEGWQPFGQLFMTNTHQWVQVIVKYKTVAQRSLTEPLSLTKHK